MKLQNKLILASQSPRRRDLLAGLGIVFDTIPADINEDRIPGEGFREYVSRLSRTKAEVVATRFPDRPVLAADTTVASLSGDVLEKPLDLIDAKRMITLLQGTTHIVATAFSLKWNDKNILEQQTVETKVKMLPLTEAAILAYVATEEGFDKAGGYGGQGIAAAFIESVEGSFTNVIGLPLAEVVITLSRHGIWSLENLPKTNSPRK